MARSWFEVWFNENFEDKGFSASPREDNQSEVQTWEVKRVDEDSGTLTVNADDRLSLKMNLGYPQGKSTLYGASGSGMASTRGSSGISQQSQDEREIIEEYEEGDQIAVAAPAGELGKAFIIKKLTGMKATTYTNLVISNGED